MGIVGVDSALGQAGVPVPLGSLCPPSCRDLMDAEQVGQHGCRQVRRQRHHRGVPSGVRRQAVAEQAFASHGIKDISGPSPGAGRPAGERSIRVGLTRRAAVHVTDRADRGADRHLHPCARPIRRPAFPPCHRRRGFLPCQHPQGPPTLRAHDAQLLQAAHCPHHDPGVGDRTPSPKGHDRRGSGVGLPSGPLCPLVEGRQTLPIN